VKSALGCLGCRLQAKARFLPFFASFSEFHLGGHQPGSEAVAFEETVFQAEIIRE
jgi:hypothetical protein